MPGNEAVSDCVAFVATIAIATIVLIIIIVFVGRWTEKR